MTTATTAKEKRDLLTLGTKPEVRKAEGEPTKIIGYAVRWEQLSHPIMGMFQEQFQRGAFTETLQNPDVYAAWQHDSREVLGRTPGTLQLFEDDIGLRYEIQPPSWAEKHVETIERGDVRGSSFIFRSQVEEWDETGDMAVRTVTKAELFEVSPVTTPAYPQSSVGVRSAEETFQARPQPDKTDDEAEKRAAALLQLQMRRKKLNL